MKTAGIFGAGFVGGTCFRVFSQLNNKKWEIRLYDIIDEKRKNSFEETALCQVVFVALPTPMDAQSGECHTGIVESCVAKIREINKDNLIVIKSTVPPGTTARLNEKYGKVCFNPEFLTEAKAYWDFIELPYQILGKCDKDDNLSFLRDLYQECVWDGLMECEDIFEMDATSAEMVKYLRNCYLATRLSFFNEMKQICDKLQINYKTVVKFAGLDQRVGGHYNDARGFWGGHCLPKDLNALKFLATSLGIDPKVLEGVWQKNLELSSPDERDWEKMQGRAVINGKNDPV